MKRRTIIVGALLILTLVLSVYAKQLQQASPQVSQKNQTIKVDVDLTLVNATVLERLHGRIVTDLKVDDFEVWEDKIQQSIEYFSEEDAAISLGVIFDVSGSMKEKLPVARDAALAFLKTGNTEDEYFLIEFNSRPQITQDFTTDISRLQNHLMFTPAGGTTALFDATYLGLQKLRDGVNTKKALLLITDGVDNHSRYTFKNVRDFIKEQDIQLYAIGIDSQFYSYGEGQAGRALIEELTDLTGGRAFFATSVYELPDICTKIALELKNQYVLGYRSTNGAKDGKWRRITLRVHPPAGMPDMSIRGKSGYYAPTDSGNH